MLMFYKKNNASLTDSFANLLQNAYDFFSISLLYTVMYYQTKCYY